MQCDNCLGKSVTGIRTLLGLFEAQDVCPEGHSQERKDQDEGAE